MSFSTHHWRTLEELFEAALAREPAARAAFLKEACPDESLRREVASLLDARGAGDDLLERPAIRYAAAGLLSGQTLAHASEASAALGRRHPFLWVVWLVTASLTAAFGYAAWKMTRDVPAFGWSETRRGDLWLVASVDPSGPAADKLRPGELILSVNGDQGVAHAGTAAYRRVLGIGESYRVQVRRGSEVFDYFLETARGRPNIARALLGYSLGLGWCVIGVFIGFARPQDPAARLAFGAAALTGFVFLQVYNLPALWALQPLHGVLGYHFFYRFPGIPPRNRGWRILLGLLYLGALYATANRVLFKFLLFAQGPQSANLVAAGPFANSFEKAGWPVFGVAMVAAVAVAVHKYRTVTDSGQRRRFHWVALGGVIGLAPEVPFTLLTFLHSNPRIAAWLLPGTAWTWCNWMVNWSSIAVPLGVAYAVVRHQVFDVRVAIRRGVQYLLARRALQALLAIPSAALVYTLVAHRHWTLEELVIGTWAYLFWIAALGVSLKFRSALVHWLDKKFFREQYDREQIIMSLVDDLAAFDSVEEMSGFVFAQLERSLHPKSMRLWWREAGGLKLAHSSDPGLARAPCPVSESLLDRLGNVTSVPLSAATGVSKIEALWLAQQGVRLVVPLIGVERLEGVLMLGEKRSEEAYSDGDARLLHAAGREAAVIRDNHRLKERVGDERRIRRDVLAVLERGSVNLLQECPACGACFDTGTQNCERDGTLLTLTLPVTRTVGERYRLEQLIGRGGMGAVYEARDLRLGRRVAVKIMLGGDFGHENALRRFRREAQAIARLGHPNIVSVFDFGEIEGGGAYLVMERAHGATLRAEMKRAGIFSSDDTAAWFEQILCGLAAAHERGVIHRDLKPENILGEGQGSGSLAVKILDFGLAKIRPLSTDGSAPGTITESGILLGTLAYMAPEQLAGEEVDQRADLYAAGIILLEMLTGHRPLEAAALRPPGFLPAGFPNQAALECVVRRCLARAPAERFPSAAELANSLLPALRA